MTKAVADQYAVVTRWREIADELAVAFRECDPWSDNDHERCHAALRRYEQAKNDAG